jgi:C4-dicarboxylate-specific signal transduction histidine kinase
VLTLPVIILSLLGYNLERQNAINQEMVSLSDISQKLANDIDKYIVSNNNMIRLISLNVELRNFLLNRSPTQAQALAFNQWLNLQASVSPDIDVLYLLDSDGTCVASTQASFTGQNYKIRYYFTEAMNRKIYRSDWNIGLTSGQPGIYFSAPIIDNSTVVGVVVLKLRVEKINEIISSWKYPGGDAYLLNESGIILNHTRPEYNYSALADLSDAEKIRITRNRCLTFIILITFMLNMLKRSLHDE